LSYTLVDLTSGFITGKRSDKLSGLVVSA
jgi:hypothetical protein